MFAYLLAAWLDVALYHDAFDHVADFLGMAAAVEYFFGDADLLVVHLVGIGMVGIHDAGRIL